MQVIVCQEMSESLSREQHAGSSISLLFSHEWVCRGDRGSEPRWPKPNGAAARAVRGHTVRCMLQAVIY